MVSGKLKMEDILVDKYQWIAVDSGTKPTTMSDEDWVELGQKLKSTIWLCVSYSILLNVFGEVTLYQSKSLVNKLFPRKNMYNLRMKDGNLVTEHLNAFNIVVSQLLSIDINISR